MVQPFFEKVKTFSCSKHKTLYKIRQCYSETLQTARLRNKKKKLNCFIIKKIC